MTNYREILRLHSLGLNKTEIASSCQCARNTVAATLERAANCGLQWPLPEEMSDKQLSERLFPSNASKPVYKMPDYAYVHKELQRSGITLNLLWLEYCDQCRVAGEIPYQSTQFNKYYADYLTKVNATMEQTTALAESMGLSWDQISPWCWWVTMNMMYSDYGSVAIHYGVSTAEFFAELAQAFLFDKDGPAPKEKLAAYYHGIVKAGE